MLFIYTAKNKDGKIIKGKRESANKFSLDRELRNESLVLILAEEKIGGIDFSSINHIFVRIRLHEKIIFTRNLATMLRAGVSLSRALGILEKQTKNFKLKQIISWLIDDINRGLSLSDGMKKSPKVFSPLFISMVKSGEESGGLPDSLSVIGTELDKSYTMGKKIKGAMIYPAIVLGAIFVIGTLMLIYVVPSLTLTFKDLGVDLPAPTRFVITLSDFLVNNTIVFLLSVIALFVGLFYLKRTRRGARGWNYLVLHLPIFGPIVKEVNSARTARTLSSLLSAGVPVRQALSITGDVVQNVYYKEVLDEAGVNLEKGLPLSQLFKSRIDLYPVMVGEMMEVGEETGKLSDMLEDMADFYEEEVDNTTKDMSVLVEPILMLVIGVAVGFFAVAMILPTYSILDSM